MFAFPRRVGRLDAILRFVVGVSLLATGAWLLGNVQIDWALSILHVFILGAYLVVTAVTGVDFVYNATDITTSRASR